MNLLHELKRRNVFRVAAAYVASAWFLIQVLETLFPIYGLSETALQIVVTLLAVGLVPVLAAAWAFELTPEGLKRDSEESRAQARELGTAKWLDRAIIVLLALAVGYFAFDKFVLERERQREEVRRAVEQARTDALIGAFGDQSIAVLAFDDLSPDGDHSYFSEGISEELLNLLARIPELRVAGRTSAFSFKGKDATIPEIAGALNVAHVLEGSVRKSGNRVRITAQLIEGGSDTHVWSETYDRDLDDIFEIQEEIAARVVRRLQPLLIENLPRIRRTDPVTYDLYLKALDGWRNDDPVEDVVDALHRIIDRDANYSPAMTSLALVYWRATGPAEFHRYKPAKGYALHRDALERALAIDPDDGIAAGGLGTLMLYDGSDPEAGARMIERAVAAYPGSSRVLRIAANFARDIGRFPIGMALARRAVAIDPLCRECYWTLALNALSAELYPEAEAAIRKVREFLPDCCWQVLGDALLLSGDAEAALETYDLHFDGPLGPDWGARARALHSMGRQAEFSEAMAKLEENPDQERYVRVARTYAWAGMPDDAFRWLDNGRQSDGEYFSHQFLPFQAHHPMWRGVHDDPRWAALWEHIGITEDQLAAIELDIALPP